MMKNENENLTIGKFFQNSNVLLTGGTGFLGKLLISKLLLTCQVSRIYLLIRKKKSKTSLERMRELFENPVFDRLKSTLPEYEKHIVVVDGDCAQENLGLCHEDVEMLCHHVDVVIHSAAAMNMIGSLKVSIQINIKGTINLVRLAKNMINLKCFSYVSTFGAFFDQEVIEEKFYNLHVTYEDLLNLLKIDNVIPIDSLDEKIITGSKGTIYGVSKAVAEHIFLKEKLHIPVMIFRCSVVTCCWEEPLSGWTDNFYGTNGMIAISLSGIQQVFYGNVDMFEFGDMVPADYVINALLGATVFSYCQFYQIKETNSEISPFIFNYSSAEHPLTLNTIVSYMKKEFNEYPSLYSNMMLYRIWIFFLYYIPAVLIDTAAFFIGEHPGLLKIYKMANEISLKYLSHITPYRVVDNNVKNCWKSLDTDDKKLYPFHLNSIKWEEFLPIYIQSVQQYISGKHKYSEFVSGMAWVKRIRYCFGVLYGISLLYCLFLVYKWNR